MLLNQMIAKNKEIPYFEVAEDIEIINIKTDIVTRIVEDEVYKQDVNDTDIYPQKPEDVKDHKEEIKIVYKKPRRILSKKERIDQIVSLHREEQSTIVANTPLSVLIEVAKERLNEAKDYFEIITKKIKERDI